MPEEKRITVPRLEHLETERTNLHRKILGNCWGMMTNFASTMSYHQILELQTVLRNEDQHFWTQAALDSMPIAQKFNKVRANLAGKYDIEYRYIFVLQDDISAMEMASVELLQRHLHRVMHGCDLSVPTSITKFIEGEVAWLNQARSNSPRSLSHIKLFNSAWKKEINDDFEKLRYEFKNRLELIRDQIKLLKTLGRI